MNYTKIFGVLLLISFLAIPPSLGAEAAKNEEPPIPYYDQGACPFECCTYRVWTVAKRTSLRKEHNDLSSVVSTVKSGEKVRGLTGVVITSKPGKVKILKSAEFTRQKDNKQISLHPGDVIYNLHYVGEDYDKFWYRGQILVDQTDIREIGKTEWWEVISLPEWVWWAKIKGANGSIGWTRELENFKDIDACG